jgi:hypothetical protein
MSKVMKWVFFSNLLSLGMYLIKIYLIFKKYNKINHVSYSYSTCIYIWVNDIFAQHWKILSAWCKASNWPTQEIQNKSTNKLKYQTKVKRKINKIASAQV